MKHLIKSTLLLLALLLPATALAHDFCVDGIYYNILNNNEAEVTYKGPYSWNHNTYSGSVTIPATVTYNGTTYSVTTIGDCTFYDCSGLTNVIIPNSVTSIGSCAFSGCSKLTSVTIPNSVTSIGSAAFDGTAWFNNLPDGLVYAGLVAYKYKGTMPDGTSIYIKDGTVSIAGSAFTGCSGLTSVTIPNSVISIGVAAFHSCIGLSKVIIPNSVTSIDIAAFAYCSSLTQIIVASDNLVFDSRDNCNAIINTASNMLIVGCMNTSIPNSVTSIGKHAFSECKTLTNINIPNSVTSIGEYAFDGCSGLTSIIIPNSVIHIGDAAFMCCYGLTSITIPNSITSIGNYAFDGCSGLTSITIPNSITSIGNYAFDGCSGLTSITIPNSVTSIGDYAFSDCYGLSDVYSYTTGLSSVSIGDSVFSLFEENYSNRTLHVPVGSLEAYQADDRWYPYFGQIVEIDLMGDANIDGHFNIGDVCDTIDYLLGYEVTPFNPAGADLNGNGRVDLGDLVDLIDLLFSN